jgi:hypothetical protein
MKYWYVYNSSCRVWMRPCRYLPIKEFTYFITSYCSTACSRKLLRADQSGVRFPTESRNCSLLQNVQTGSEAYPTSYPVGMRVFDQYVNRPWCKADHLTPTILKFKISWDISPPTRLHGQKRASFTFHVKRFYLHINLPFKLHYIQSHWNIVHTFTRCVL